ncbi:hypothetical protein [Pseudonocardia sp. ICBG601]|uniref:hypothetical protein n=1 Tax=Pseudonocardia sp. ICBG601 TaxID=2846759 RepID=UPI001CF63DD2|nr:hypothetical protein [Pseudonocardia sp. ICBG601]
MPARRRARRPDRPGPAEPRQRVRVRPAHRGREERLRADPRRAGRRARPGRGLPRRRRPHRAGRGRAGPGGVPGRAARLRPHRRPALLRAGLRGARPGAGRTRHPDTLAAVADAFHAAHRALYGYDFAGDPGQQVEWVNLRVSGIGPIRRREIATHDLVADPVVAAAGRRPVCFDAAQGYLDTPVYRRTDLVPGAVVDGPAIVEEFGSTVPLHPGFTARVDSRLNIIVTRRAAQ